MENSDNPLGKSPTLGEGLLTSTNHIAAGLLRGGPAEVSW